jgi:hypothetical protein
MAVDLGLGLSRVREKAGSASVATARRRYVAGTAAVLVTCDMAHHRLRYRPNGDTSTGHIATMPAGPPRLRLCYQAAAGRRARGAADPGLRYRRFRLVMGRKKRATRRSGLAVPLTNVLAVDYLAPDVPRAVPQLGATGGCVRGPWHRRRWTAPLPLPAGRRPSGPVAGRASHGYRAVTTGEVTA